MFYLGFMLRLLQVYRQHLSLGLFYTFCFSLSRPSLHLSTPFNTNFKLRAPSNNFEHLSISRPFHTLSASRTTFNTPQYQLLECRWQSSAQSEILAEPTTNHQHHQLTPRLNTTTSICLLLLIQSNLGKWLLSVFVLAIEWHFQFGAPTLNSSFLSMIHCCLLFRVRPEL